MKISYSLFSLMILLLFAIQLQAAEIVVQTGVASPQAESEKDNIEILRERAIRNALDLAMLQVAGVTLSSERGNTLRTKEDVIVSDDKVTEQSKQQSRFHGTLVSRTSGHARLVTILKEWKDLNQYYVNAEIEVIPPEEFMDKMNAGFFWERAGKPSIHLTLFETNNGQKAEIADNKSFIYFRDNLVKNGINIIDQEKLSSQYLIRVNQVFQTEQLPAYGTFTSHCELSFEIMLQERNTILSEYRASNGPSAGFTANQAQEACIKAIAPEVSGQMVRKLAAIMNDCWNNGIEYQLSIDELPEGNLIEASTILENLFRVSSSNGITYQDNVLSLIMTYKGTAVDLAEAVHASFEQIDWVVTPVTLEKNKVMLRWAGQN